MHAGNSERRRACERNEIILNFFHFFVCEQKAIVSTNLLWLEIHHFQ